MKILFDHLVLAGGGHTHALMLLRWAKYPHLKPQGLITLINRDSTTIYSSMLPGVISGEYRLEDSLINLRQLADMAGVSFVLAEIIGLNAAGKVLYLDKRPDIHFNRISLDLGSGTNLQTVNHIIEREEFAIPIKPFRKALKWIEFQDSESSLINKKSFSVIGAGLAGLEIIFALRKRWPDRPLNLQVTSEEVPRKSLRKSLLSVNINLVDRDVLLMGPSLICTGSRAPAFLRDSGLTVDPLGRVCTLPTFQAKEYSYIFASGDCGVIDKFPRPPAGVWAVRAAKPLSKNIERQSLGLNLLSWEPQKNALQLLGGPFTSQGSFGWSFFGNVVLGPNTWIWKLKKIIDRRFVGMFLKSSSMFDDLEAQPLCRGCASKIPAHTLKKALKEAKLSEIGDMPEDAAFISDVSICSDLIQSVDGFPALISDPWLNARLTTLHACSDIWATGASVISAQPIITLPIVSESLQGELLTQVLGGIKSVLGSQNAQIIGGHTLESRDTSSKNSSIGIQITLSVNGLVPNNQKVWKKNGLQPNDVLLISRPLGSGILFAASMGRKVDPINLDFAINHLNSSQHVLVEKLFQKQQEQINDHSIVHACTDITGFGLLGHLNEMLESSNFTRLKNGLKPLRIRLEAEKIPVYPGVLELIGKGYSSTLAPANRRFWNLFETNINHMPTFKLEFKDMAIANSHYHNTMELLVDPQTCGPLVLACSKDVAKELISDGVWSSIGLVETI